MTSRPASILRASEWWDDKLVPIISAYYATLLLLDRPIAPHWPDLIALFLSMLVGAAFVSMVNDVTDLDEDRAAGKPNRMEGRPRTFRLLAVLLPATAGLFFLWLWRDDPGLVAAYLAAWIAFSLYSMPPFRLKARGLAGVLSDASGAHLFPTMVAILLAFRAAGAPVQPLWLATGAAWALGYGLRGILWHQLCDREADRAAGVRTFAQRHPPAMAARIGAWLAFPLEIAGLGAMMAMLASPWPPLLLALHLLLVAARRRWWRVEPIVVAPAPRYLILLHEYYGAFWPIALLLASALRAPADLAVLACHLLLFARHPWRIVDDLRILLVVPVVRRIQSR